MPKVPMDRFIGDAIEEIRHRFYDQLPGHAEENWDSDESSRLRDSSFRLWQYVKSGYDKQLDRGLAHETFSMRKTRADFKLHERLNKLVAECPDISIDELGKRAEAAIDAIHALRKYAELMS